MESEHQLQSVYGSKRPFSVPDDYFSRLPSRIMAQLPAEERKEKSAAEKPYRVLVRRLRPLAAAAMTVGVVLTGFLAYSMFLSPKEGSMTGPSAGREPARSRPSHRRMDLTRRPTTS